MARMLGKFSRPYCRRCACESGPDCPDYSRSKRSQKAKEKRDWGKTIVDAIEEVFDVFT